LHKEKTKVQMQINALMTDTAPIPVINH